MGEQIAQEEQQEAQEAQESQETQAQQPNYEERARLQGWVPKEEFRGDKAAWITADEYVKRADNMMPILKSVNKKLEARAQETESELRETKETLKRIVAVQEKYQSDLHNVRKTELQEKKRRAVEAGDIELYDRLEKQEQSLPQPEKIETKPDDGIPDGTKRWVDDNSSWFNVDRELTDYALYLNNKMIADKHPLAVPGKEYEFGEVIKQQLQNTFPNKFKNPSQNSTDMDETNLRGGDNIQSNGNTWNDLPGDAKLYWQNVGQHIPGFTKEKYIKAYFEE